MLLSHIKCNKLKLSHSYTQWLSLFFPESCFMSWHRCDPRVDECLAPRETHREGWDSGISALSARPNDGIHLLFYGHSWSSVAPIWPKAHNLSLFLHLSLPYFLPCSSLFYPLLLSFSHTFILVVQPTCSQCPLCSPPPIFIHLPVHHHPSFTFSSFLRGSLP